MMDILIVTATFFLRHNSLFRKIRSSDYSDLRKYIMIIKLFNLNNYSISEHFTLHINHYWRLIVEGYRELTKLKIQLKF